MGASPWMAKAAQGPPENARSSGECHQMTRTVRAAALIRTTAANSPSLTTTQRSLVMLWLQAKRSVLCSNSRLRSGAAIKTPSSTGKVIRASEAVCVRLSQRLKKLHDRFRAGREIGVRCPCLMAGSAVNRVPVKRLGRRHWPTRSYHQNTTRLVTTSQHLSIPIGTKLPAVEYETALANTRQHLTDEINPDL